MSKRLRKNADLNPEASQEGMTEKARKKLEKDLNDKLMSSRHDTTDKKVRLIRFDPNSSPIGEEVTEGDPHQLAHKQGHVDEAPSCTPLQARGWH